MGHGDVMEWDFKSKSLRDCGKDDVRKICP